MMTEQNWVIRIAFMYILLGGIVSGSKAARLSYLSYVRNGDPCFTDCERKTITAYFFLWPLIVLRYLLNFTYLKPICSYLLKWSISTAKFFFFFVPIACWEEITKSQKSTVENSAPKDKES